MNRSLRLLLRRRLRRAAAIAGLAAVLGLGARAAHAQAHTEAARLSWSVGTLAEPADTGSANWGERLRGVVQEKLGPIYASFSDLLRPAVGSVTWGGTVHFEGASYGYDGRRPDFARAFAPGVASQAATSEDTFSPLLLNPRRFRVPWLVAPSNQFHAMPVLPVAAIGPLRIDLVAASLGINSGTSAALMEVALRF